MENPYQAPDEFVAAERDRKGFAPDVVSWAAILPFFLSVVCHVTKGFACETDGTEPTLSEHIAWVNIWFFSSAACWFSSIIISVLGALTKPTKFSVFAVAFCGLPVLISFGQWALGVFWGIST